MALTLLVFMGFIIEGSITMNKLFLGLILVLGSVTASAATLTLDEGMTNHGSGTSVGYDEVNADGTHVTDTFQLTTDADTSAQFELTVNPNSTKSVTTVTIDGTAYGPGVDNPLILGLWLTSGVHTIVIDIVDAIGGNSTFNYDFSVTATPIPAAIWLFGSMLMGFFGLRSRVAK